MLKSSSLCPLTLVSCLGQSRLSVASWVLKSVYQQLQQTCWDSGEYHVQSKWVEKWHHNNILEFWHHRSLLFIWFSLNLYCFHVHAQIINISYFNTISRVFINFNFLTVTVYYIDIWNWFVCVHLCVYVTCMWHVCGGQWLTPGVIP